MWKCDPVLLDVNKDGRLDLAAIGRKGDGPHVWLGDGAGNWADRSVGLTGPSSSGGGVAFADIDNDGFLDLAHADHCHGVAVHLGSADGTWTRVASGIYPVELAEDDGDHDELRGSEDVDIGDFNGDGDLDLVSGATDQGGVAIYLGDGTGKNWSFLDVDLPRKGAANRVQFVDINKDGNLDVAATTQFGPRVWLGDGKGSLTDASAGLPSPLFGGLYRGLAFADVNEDGRLDLAAANWIDGPEIYFQTQEGSWQKSPDVFPQMKGGAVGLTLGDVNADGNIDLVVSGKLHQTVGYVYGVFLLEAIPKPL